MKYNFPGPTGRHLELARTDLLAGVVDGAEDEPAFQVLTDERGTLERVRAEKAHQKALCLRWIEL